jgi:hypothetical protein
MSTQLITKEQLLDQASQFLLDPAGQFVLRRWSGDTPDNQPAWVISDTWSYAQFLNMEGNWEEKEDSDEWRKKVLWSEPLAAASFYYGWRNRFYWIYVKGAGDRQWYYQFFSEDLEKAEKCYSDFQSKRPGLHWMLVGPDRKIIRENVGEKKQKWVEYPLNVVPEKA